MNAKARTIEDHTLFAQIAHTPYAKRYGEWLARRADAKGYDFGVKVSSATTPAFTVESPPRWYSIDRPRRLARERAQRDRWQMEILALATKPSGHHTTDFMTRVVTGPVVVDVTEKRHVRSAA